MFHFNIFQLIQTKMLFFFPYCFRKCVPLLISLNLFCFVCFVLVYFVLFPIVSLAFPPAPEENIKSKQQSVGNMHKKDLVNQVKVLRITTFISLIPYLLMSLTFCIQLFNLPSNPKTWQRLKAHFICVRIGILCRMQYLYVKISSFSTLYLPGSLIFKSYF